MTGLMSGKILSDSLELSHKFVRRVKEFLFGREKDEPFIYCIANSFVDLVVVEFI